MNKQQQKESAQRMLEVIFDRLGGDEYGAKAAHKVAALMAVNVATVKRWRNGDIDITGSRQVMIKMFYCLPKAELRKQADEALKNV